METLSKYVGVAPYVLKCSRSAPHCSPIHTSPSTVSDSHSSAPMGQTKESSQNGQLSKASLLTLCHLCPLVDDGCPTLWGVHSQQQGPILAVPVVSININLDVTGPLV